MNRISLYSIGDIKHRTDTDQGFLKIKDTESNCLTAILKCQSGHYWYSHSCSFPKKKFSIEVIEIRQFFKKLHPSHVSVNFQYKDIALGYFKNLML